MSATGTLDVRDVIDRNPLRRLQLGALLTCLLGAFTDTEIGIYARALAQPGAIRGSLEWYRAFPQDAVDNRRLAKDPLTIPVLALGGEDRWGPRIVDMLREFATDVTGGSIPDCGHWVVEERPAAVLAALDAFLAS